MDIKNISPTQRKIIIKGLILVGAYLALWFMLYLPARHQAGKIKVELSVIEEEIKEIETLIGKRHITGEDIKLLRERYRMLNGKFPEKEEEALRVLSDFAKKLNIELISIKPRPKEICRDENDKQIIIEGKVCQKVFVSVRVKCQYEDLVKYIRALKDELPSFVIIEKLDVSKDAFKKTSELHIILNCNLYLLS